MPDSLFLYDRDKGLFKEILKKSSVIAGRYFVVSSGFDINTTDLNNIVDVQKYPCVICSVPNVGPTANNRFEHAFTLYFLTRYAHTGQGDIKDVDPNTLNSLHPSWYDWNDMEQVARNFYKKLRSVIASNYLGIAVKWNSAGYIVKAGSDIVNGFRLSLTTSVSDICELNDYEGAEDIVIPPLQIHPLHKL